MRSWRMVFGRDSSAINWSMMSRLLIPLTRPMSLEIRPMVLRLRLRRLAVIQFGFVVVKGRPVVLHELRQGRVDLRVAVGTQSVPCMLQGPQREEAAGRQLHLPQLLRHRGQVVRDRGQLRFAHVRVIGTWTRSG